jgi:hypothetical protein
MTMQFLHVNESAGWCEEHGMAIGDRFELLPDARLVHESRLVYAPHGPVGHEAQVLEICIAMLGEWDECLLWPTAWDIWTFNEDWPRFYGARGARGERVSLSMKPGHLFDRSEVAELRLFLGMAIDAGWDAHLLPVSSLRADRRLQNSHDGWLKLHSSIPESLPELAALNVGPFRARG